MDSLPFFSILNKSPHFYFHLSHNNDQICFGYVDFFFSWFWIIKKKHSKFPLTVGYMMIITQRSGNYMSGVLLSVCVWQLVTLTHQLWWLSVSFFFAVSGTIFNFNLFIEFERWEIIIIIIIFITFFCQICPHIMNICRILFVPGTINVLCFVYPLILMMLMISFLVFFIICIM